MPLAGPSLPLPEVSQTMTVLLAGGRGSRLHELTARTCKPAVPFAGQHRIVDFTMANVVRSGLRRMIVATQYRPETLHDHLAGVWSGSFPSAGLRLREGRRVTGNRDGYCGTAAAVHANAAEIDASGATTVLVLAADHVYDMDYAPMIAHHLASGKSVTVAADCVPVATAAGFGVIDADSTGAITRFLEKPAHPPAMVGNPDQALVSMGIYVFDWAWLRRRLQDDARNPASGHDFGHDIVPAAVDEGGAQVFRRATCDSAAPYWRDVGTLDAYRLAQLDFMADAAPCALPRPGRDTPQGGLKSHSGDGNVILPGARVAPGARLRKVIVAAGAHVPAGLSIGHDRDEDRRWFRVADGGTVLVTADMLAQRAAVRSRGLFSLTLHNFSPRGLI